MPREETPQKRSLDTTAPKSFDPFFKLVLLGLFLLFFVSIGYYYGWFLPLHIGTDYQTYYHAARLTFLSGTSPYGPHAFDPVLKVNNQPIPPFLSLPPSLLILWPLTKFSPAKTQILYLTCNQLCYIGSIWLILFELTPKNPNERLQELITAFSLVYILCFDPGASTFGTGEISFITLFLICLALTALRHDSSPWRIALPLSIAIVLKTYPALLLIPLLFRKHYRSVGLTAVFLSIIAAISWLVLPRGVWHSWYADMLPLTGYINTRLPLAISWNQSLNAFVMRLLKENYFSRAPFFHPSLARPTIYLLVIAFVSVTSLCSLRITRAKCIRWGRDEDIPVFLLLMFLIAPLSWDHHLVYALPATAVAINLIFGGSLSRLTSTALVAALLVMAWKLPLDSQKITEGWLTLLISIKLYCVIALWLFFVSRMNPLTVSATYSH